MVDRNIALKTARVALDVLDSTRAMERIEQDGYTRVDPFKIAAGEDVSVLLKPLDQLYGAFIRDDRSGILVNSARSAGLIHMTCAHELGHYFMGHDSAVDETLDYPTNAEEREQEAETFGYNLLVPRPLLTIICRRKGWNRASLTNPFVLYQLSLRLGISYSATAWSLFRHSLIAYGDVQQLRKTQPAAIKKALLRDRLPDATKEVWLLDSSDQSSVLEPRAEDHLVVRLKSHASAGYLWLADSRDDLEAEGFSLAPLPAPAADPSTLVFGADDSMDYLLSNGDTELDTPQPVQLSEIRPWMGKQEKDASYRSQAHFEAIQEGLTREAKLALMREVAAS
ncbi:ImmA/IrrE family metallo-endopeptidase [Pseudomonas luteola]|uniref:ImmA/IrrE family metallo-endopeptidase n=1 Tax=Pseudomonas luteola TaxID=47886 RepID=UPI000F7A4630|nr:ImmA/IrrE family metallo-endopeptidase [Pseudomonas luteola]RRW42893.1 ImmA/IrrE family metallo-endopeptidase [Pseudomonas luteola]